MNAYLPKNLELHQTLTGNPPQFKYDEDNFRYILSQVNEIPAYNRTVVKNNGFVPMNASLLQEKVHNYKLYLDYLIDNEIIECDGHYKRGEKSKGYRFSDSFQTELKAEPIVKYSLVKRAKKKVTLYNYQMQNKYDYLFKWFDSNLSFDMNGALDYLHDQRTAASESDEKLRSFNTNWIRAHKLSNKDYFFRIDQNVGRCHTNLTNLRSDLRHFVSYGGQSLVSVDVRNSQPLLSGLLLHPAFYAPQRSSSDTLLNISRERWDKKFKLRGNIMNSILSSIMLVNNMESLDNHGFNRYWHLVNEGKLYEFIHQHLQANDRELITDRQRLKEVVFTAMFTDNRFMAQPEAAPKRLFKSLFPDVYEVFRQLKRPDPTVLPRLLQAIEARVIIDYIAKRIAREHPDMPMYTIHDSIVCPKGYEGYVANVIEEEIRLRVGMKPTLKLEEWSPDNLSARSQITIKR
jgi:hypothetical protein